MATATSDVEPIFKAAATGMADSPSYAASLQPDACQQAVGRIIKSKHFEKAARLSALLEFVCKLALEGRSAEISESTIGVAVFSRSENYNTSDDNIVRSTMRLLRQRLDRYYAEEGSIDPVRIEIPRGAYQPVFSDHFHAISVANPAAGLPAGFNVDMPALSAATSQTSPSRRSFLRLSGLTLLFAAAAVTSFEVGRSNKDLFQSRFDRFWGIVFPKDRETLIVPADTMLMMYERAAHRTVPLEQYVSGNFAPPSEALADPEERGLLSSVHNKRYTAVTSVGIAASLGRVAAPDRTPKVKFSRDLRLDDLKQSNVILIGAEQNNPWVHLFRQHLNFHLDWISDNKRFRVLNDHPLAGESAEWNWTKEDADHRGYGQIAFLPNLSGQGHVLLIAGTSMDGTQAAAEFLMDPKRMEPILRQVNIRGKEAGGFEVLLLAKVLDHGTIAAMTLGTRYYPIR